MGKGEGGGRFKTFCTCTGSLATVCARQLASIRQGIVVRPVIAKKANVGACAREGEFASWSLQRPTRTHGDGEA